MLPRQLHQIGGLVVWQRWHRVSKGSFPLAILLVVGACSGAPAPQASGATSLAPGTTAGPGGAGVASVAAATAILQAANFSDVGTIVAVDRVRFSDAGIQAAGDLIRSGATGNALWAATYVYGSSAQDPALLKPVAADPKASASIRAMAGARLISAGDPSGFDSLIATLAASDQMDGADPAGQVWEFAADVLERYTHTGFGPALAASDPERATAQATWTTWLNSNRSKLHFDAASQLWTAG
jgi:hypothetical protein